VRICPRDRYQQDSAGVPAAGAALGIVSRDADDDGQAADSLTLDQIGTLQLAIVEAGADIGRFCNVCGIEWIEQLPASKLDSAMTRLATFREWQQKK